MANVLVCVELRDAHPTSPSLFALGEARRVAERLGATVYALVVTGAASDLAEVLPDTLGQAGADRVLLVDDARAEVCPVFPLWQPLFAQVVEALHPRLVVFPAGSFGLQLGPPLAAEIAAAFIPRASLEIAQDDEGEADGGSDGAGGGPDALHFPPVLLAHRWNPEQSGRLSIDLGASPAPAVVTLTAGLPAAFPGKPAELQMLMSVAGSESVTPGPAVSDPRAALDLTQTAVLVPAGQAELVSQLGPLAPPGTALLLADEVELLHDAAPRLVLLLAGKPLPAGLSGLRLAPDAHLALAGTRRTVPPAPLGDRVWLVKRSELAAQLRAAFATVAASASAAQAVPEGHAP